MGWVQIDWRKKGSAGLLVESILDCTAEGFPIADFQGIEIKTMLSNHFVNVSLFSLVPSNAPMEINRIKEEYGTIIFEFPEQKNYFVKYIVINCPMLVLIAFSN